MTTAFKARRFAAVGMVGLLIVLAVGGGGYLWSKYRALEDRSLEYALEHLQRASVTLSEVQRLVGSLRAFDGDGDVDAWRREAKSRLDVIFVRLDAFSRDQARYEDDAPYHLLNPLRTYASIVDGHLRAPVDSLPRKLEAVRKLERRASVSLLEFANSQWRVKRTGVERQSLVLERLLASAAVLLLLFVGVAGASLWLWSGEMRARNRIAKAESEARLSAYYDGLTRVPNRSYFYTQAAAMVGAWNDGPSPAAILVDVDDFKLVNDAHGHHVGDALLVAIAGHLQKVADRHGGVAARIGGDEFAVMLPSWSGVAALEAVCADILETCRAPVAAGAVTIEPQISMGAVLGTELDETLDWTVDGLLKAADAALYNAKEHGKNQFAIFDSALRRALREEEAMAAALAKAVEDRSLSLAFQPQVDMRDGRIIGVEALSRWSHDGAPVRPDIFIAVAEKTGLVREVDYLALEGAVAALAGWRKAGHADLRVSVNLSPVHFLDNRIVDVVARLLARSDIAPEQLTLEITETMLLEDWDRVLQLIDSLSELGVEMALDDFGTGYSSIGYLRRLTVQELKIDRSMIIDIERSDESQALLAAIAGLAHALKMRLVVEGVETAGQAAILRSHGCEVGQGFGYSRPVDAQAMGALLAADAPLIPPLAEAS